MTLEELEKRHRELSARVDENFEEIEKVADESMRVAEVAEKTPTIIKDLNREFESITKLTSTDVAFLFVATAMQIVRQYLLTQFPERMDDQEAAKGTKGHNEEHSDRKHRYYKPSVEEIICNPVPFDANRGADGALSGGGKMGHRVTALGHDPVIGLAVGTCNIATSTLTTNKLQSYHIFTDQDKRDAFRNKASTIKIFEESGDKILNQGMEGKIIMGTSLVKEIIHLKSDIHTKHSLPLPAVSMIDGKLASKLASYGLDMSNVASVTKQATMSILINTIIAMIHGLFAPEEMSGDLYEVRTRRILSYSNVIASSSNLIYVGANLAGGNESALKSLDIGGLIVTCYRVATDSKFIQAAKQEFIEKKYFEQIRGEAE